MNWQNHNPWTESPQCEPSIDQQQMKTAVIYHKADLDGQVSGFLAYQHAEKNGDVRLFPYDYGEPIEEIMGYCMLEADEIFMTDVSLPLDYMRGLAYHPNFHWIDHHITAIKEFEHLNLNGCALVEDERGRKISATELAWRYFNHGEDMPYLVHHVGRYDVWDKSDPASEQFQYGLRCEKIDITTEKSRDTLSTLIRTQYLCNVVRDLGRMILNYTTGLYADQAKERAFTVEVDGIRFCALNTAGRGSLQVEAAYDPEKHDALMVFGYTGDGWSFSVYGAGKDDIDLGAFAKSMGGGGHRGAAGFRRPTLPTWLIQPTPI